MKNVIFDDNSTKIHIQCNFNDKMIDIFKKYSCKIRMPLDSLFFIYLGNKIDENLTLEQILDNNNNKESNEIKIIVSKKEYDDSDRLSKKNLSK